MLAACNERAQAADLDRRPPGAKSSGRRVRKCGCNQGLPPTSPGTRGERARQREQPAGRQAPHGAGRSPGAASSTARPEASNLRDLIE